MNQQIKLELSVAEVNDILKVLGDLPTKSGAWPLVVKIKTQADAYIQTQQQLDLAPTASE